MVSVEQGNDVFIALLRVQKLLLAARTTAPRAHPGVDAAAYPVLFAIAGGEGIRISDLAAALHNDASTVSRHVSALVAHGLVAKAADPADGRVQSVSLTETGWETLRKLRRTRALWFQRLLADWDADETEEFVRHLRALGDALDTHLRSNGATPPTLPPDTLGKD